MKMKIFAIADLHLSFNENINKPMWVFGDDWENHTERLKEACEEMMSDEDIVLIPGDISWALRLEDAIPDFEWIHKLPGTKILSKGNHDLWWSRINYMNSLYEGMVFLQNESYHVVSENIAICATRGWPYPGSDDYTDHDEKIYKRELLRLKMGLDSAVKKAPDAKIIVALHFPPAGQNGSETGFTKMLEEYGVWKCVYGHLHGQKVFSKGIKGNYRGVEYSLVSLDYLGAIPKLIYDGD